MIKRLKKKFIILATVSMAIIMTMLVGIMNIINYSAVVTEADTILDILSQPDAPFDDHEKTKSLTIFICCMKTLYIL